MEYPRQALASAEEPEAEVALVRNVGIGASGAPETVIEREAIKGPEPSMASQSGDAGSGASGATASRVESPGSVAEHSGHTAPTEVATPRGAGVVSAEKPANGKTDTVQVGSEEPPAEGGAESSASAALSSALRETEEVPPSVGQLQGASAAPPSATRAADVVPRASVAAEGEEKTRPSLWIWLVVAAVAAAGVYWVLVHHAGRRPADAADGAVVSATAAGLPVRPREVEPPPAQPDTQPGPSTSGTVTAAPLPEGSADAAEGSAAAPEGAPLSDAAASEARNEEASDAGLAASGESLDSTKDAVGESVDAAAAPAAGTVRVQLYVEPLDTRVARRGARVKPPYIFDIRKGERVVLELVRAGFTTRRVVLDGKQKIVRVGMRSYQARPRAPAAAAAAAATPTPETAPTPEAPPTVAEPVPAP